MDFWEIILYAFLVMVGAGVIGFLIAQVKVINKPFLFIWHIMLVVVYSIFTPLSLGIQSFKLYLRHCKYLKEHHQAINKIKPS